MNARLALCFLLALSGCDSDDDMTPLESSTGGGSETSADASSSSGNDEDEVHPQVLELCECLLFDCHEPYHERYGATDLEAAEACNADGSTLPLDGVACRLSACQSGECDAALGAAAPCM